MVKVLDDAFGVEKGLMTTVHAYTGTQALVDGPSKDLREARAAAINIIPSSTGAARATSLVLESMKGRLDGTSLRVPVPDGSITDFTGHPRPATSPSTRSTTPSGGGRRAGPLAERARLQRGADRVAPTSSARRRRAPSTPRITMAIGNLVKVMGWYDNEWGYSNRLVDLIEITGAKLKARRRLPKFGVPTLEDLPPRRRQAGPRCGPTSTSRSRTARITDDLRIRAAAARPSSGCSGRAPAVTACTHLGRPKGKPDPKYDVAPVRARLAELAPGVELLENLRFDPGEEANDPAFVGPARRRLRPLRQRRLRRVAPRPRLDRRSAAHAAVRGRPAPRAEVEVLLGLRERPLRPFVAVLGGAKVSDKLGVIDALLDIVDHLVIGGGMCFTFLAAQGHRIGDSLFEPDQVDTCRALLDGRGERIHLPTDITALGPGGEIFDPDAGGDVRQLGTRHPRRLEGRSTSDPARRPSSAT